MNNNLIYVYCLTNSPPDMDVIEGFNTLVSLKIDDFHVIIKGVNDLEFSEVNFKAKLSDIEWLESNAREHVVVINKVMDKSSVIPFKFGTIFHSEERLRQFISDYSISLSENFNYIDGKEEWAVKVFCDRLVLSEKIDDLSPEAAELEKQIMASSPGKAFLLKRKKTELIENEIDRLCKLYGQEYFNGFEDLSESTSLNNLLPKEFTGREDTMILNAVFLIRKEKVGEFVSFVEQLKHTNEKSGFFIDSSGPWPPFSFISIKEKSDTR